MRELTRVRLVLCLTIVAAFELRSRAQSPVSEDVPAPGGLAAIASAVGVEPAPDRARFLAEIARVVYDVPQGRNAASDARVEHARTLGALPSDASPSGPETIPVPLTAAIWGRAVFHRQVPAATLLTTILADRQAALLARGLAALDDETLGFLASHAGLVTRLYERSAGAFSVFGGSLHIHDGRVVTPGGAEALPLWEAAVGERIDRPEAFVRELFERHAGRLAYVYQTLADIEPSKAAFAFGLWIPDRSTRLDRFKALVSATASAYRDWRVHAYPFSRPLYDLTMMLGRVRTDASGRPLMPSRATWAKVFDVASPAADAAPQEQVVDAAWLAQAILDEELQIRLDRLEQYSFGLRVFAGAPDDPASIHEALKAFPHYRMLMLTLERLGITNPRVYADAARIATRLSDLDADRGFTALAQFQGALAVVARSARARSVDPATTAALIDKLIGCPLGGDGRYEGAIVDWLEQSLRPALPAADSLEAAVLTGLAGRPRAHAEGAQPPIVSWEGQRYRLDLAAAELGRLRRVREHQGGPPIDLALRIREIARELSADKVSLDRITSAVEGLKGLEGDLPGDEPRRLAPGIDAWRNPRETLDRAVRDLQKVHQPGDSRRTSVSTSLVDLSDELAAESLLSMAYAADIGDPDGAVLLAGNVAMRHDFGYGSRDPEMRRRTAWGMPKADVAPGTPWRVRGSLLGLEVGLSSLALRRINTDGVAAAPVLTSNERDTFAASVALLDPLALSDQGRDQIASALAQGRARVASLGADEFAAAADAVAMDGWRRRAGRWLIANHADHRDVASLFSLTELLRLGGADASRFGEWGMSAVGSLGCLCTRLAADSPWTLWVGRPQLGLLATAVADLNLHVAEMLHTLQLPAALARHVLAAAVQDFIDEVKPIDANDWLTLVRSAQQVSRERVEDYVASAAAVGGPLLPEPPASGSPRMP